MTEPVRRYARAVMLGGLALVRTAAVPVVLGLGTYSAVSSPRGWAQVPASTLLAVLVGLGLVGWLFGALYGRVPRDDDLAGGLLAALLLAAVGQLLVAGSDLAGLAVGLLVAAVLAFPVRWLLRARDDARPRWAEVVVDAVTASASVPVPPARVLAAWVGATGEEGAGRLGLLDELIDAAEIRRAQGDAGARVRATDLPGLPVSLRFALALLPARQRRGPATAGAELFSGPVDRGWHETVLWHEAGHAVASWLHPRAMTPVAVTVRRHAVDAGGATVHRWETARKGQDFFVALGTMCWAGKAAEALHDPQSAAGNVGHRNDTQQAEACAEQLQRLFGDAWDAARWHAAAAALLEERRDEVGALVEHLRRYGGCGGRDLQRLLGPRPGHAAPVALPAPAAFDQSVVTTQTDRASARPARHRS